MGCGGCGHKYRKSTQNLVSTKSLKGGRYRITSPSRPATQAKTPAVTSPSDNGGNVSDETNTETK